MSALARLKAADTELRQEVAAFLAATARRLAGSPDTVDQVVTDLHNQANSLHPGGLGEQPAAEQPAQEPAAAEQQPGEPAVPAAQQGQPGAQEAEATQEASSVQPAPHGSQPPAQPPANG